MKKLIILILVMLTVVFVGCSKEEGKTSEEETAMKEKISEEVRLMRPGIDNNNVKVEDKNDVGMGKQNIVSDGGENRKAVTESYQLSSIPESYTRVNHNDNIYVYDSNGNSINVSNQLLETKVDEYSEKDCHKLISSGYKNIELKKFEHITINKKKAVLIEYLGDKNDKMFMNCCYYIENGESTISINVQAIDKSNYSKLKSIAEEIKF